MSSDFTPITKWSIPCPDDGVYADIAAEDYHKIDALNASTVKAFCKSGIHGEHELTKPPPASEALWFGGAFHSAVLEPDDFAKRMHPYQKEEGSDNETGIGPSADVAHRKYLAEHPDSIPMRKGWIKTITGMRGRIENHPDCPYLLHGTDGQNELTFIWRAIVVIDGVRVTVPCKARADRYIKGFQPHKDAAIVSGILDVKTCRDSSVSGFEKAIGTFGYHIQAAWYLAGAIRNGMIDRIHDDSYNIIAVEKTAPYPVGVYPINTASLQYGVKECERGMREYLKYRLYGHTSGPTDYKVTMGIPAWAMPADANQ